MAALKPLIGCAFLVICLAQTAYAFKEHEFKKCKDANFCARNRGVTNKYSVIPGSALVDGHLLVALVTNAANTSMRFNFTVIAYQDTVRIMMQEFPSLKVGRYEVQDVLMPGLDKRVRKMEGKTSAKYVIGTYDKIKVKLQQDPFRLEVLVDGKPAVTINSRDLFNFENRRAKQETDPTGWWEETFNGHTDSKPKGPEAISLDLAFPGAQNVYGIPERATSLALKPTTGLEPYRLYNLDVFEYLDESPFGLYGSIPLLLAHKQGLTVGAFWLNAAEMFVDVDKARDATNVQWITESGMLDLFVLAGPGPREVLQQYAVLTGTTSMPQMFAIGYHQCRWNYRDEADVKDVDSNFDKHAMPYDVLWLDIEHTNGKRYMTWDDRYFPNSIAMQEDVASRGRKMVTIVDPHVKRDPGYYMHSEAEKLGHYVKNKDNNDFDGWCWPGSSSYLDVTSAQVRQWWAAQFALDKYQGSTKHLYIWNDMNEPSVFNGPEVTMQKDNLHKGPDGPIEHRDLHNLYGFYYHLATADGLVQRGYNVEPQYGDRPFVLSRAFFSGTQRVGPIWTGDNAAQWSHLKVSIPMLLTLGVTGLPFSGADVGGFFGNPDVELLTRWYQVGQYYPFFRGHAHLETARREPWLFGEEATQRVREALRGRYALLPYLYTLFREANTTGMPIMRPLWFEFPDNKDVWTTEEEFMLGPGLLVRPVLTAGATTVDTLLPKGARWYDALSGKAQEKSGWLKGDEQRFRLKVDMEGIPAFYRGGHVVPRRERPRRSTAAQAADPITLVVALDDKHTATGSLYMDDGSSFAFTQGHYLHQNYTWASNKLSATAQKQPEGVPASNGYDNDVVIEKIVVLGLPEGSYVAKVAGQEALLEVFKGAVSMRVANSAGGAHVLRRPNVPVGKDWSITLTKAAAQQ